MINYLANPARFLRFARYFSPFCALLALFTLSAGVIYGLIISPQDYQQGHSVRILYVHVPAAWNALLAYVLMAVASFVSFVWRHPLADNGARAFAIPGAVFTFLALFTGAVWGKISWGTWWQWDGRMTSVLILFFIYIAYIMIWNIMGASRRTSRIAAIFAMVGVINIPIIKFSVEWWNSLHQSATLSLPNSPGLPPAMLIPLALMFVGYTALLGWVVTRTVSQDIRQSENRRKTITPRATIDISEIDDV